MPKHDEKSQTHRNVTYLECLILRQRGRYTNDRKHRGQHLLTGSNDCTNSLTIPPRKKQVTPVNMSGALRQNHMRRASLHFHCYYITDQAKTGGNVLLNVEDEIEDTRRQAQAEEVEQLVVNRKAMCGVCKAKKCQYEHNDGREDNEPLYACT